MTIAQPISLTPADVEIASERDGKRYELIQGELKEKIVGTESLFVALRIAGRLNAEYYPNAGFSVVEGMVYCFARANHGRKPDLYYISFDRLGASVIPKGDVRVAPNLVVEVLSPGNSGIELEEKLDEYLDAGVPMVWIVNPESRTICVYRQDGTTRLYRAADTIENEGQLPGFRLPVSDVFPIATA